MRGFWISHTLNSKISYQDNKADVILKYNADEARSLKAYGELPEHGEYILGNITY